MNATKMIVIVLLCMNTSTMMCSERDCRSDKMLRLRAKFKSIAEQLQSTNSKDAQQRLTQDLDRLNDMIARSADVPVAGIPYYSPMPAASASAVSERAVPVAGTWSFRSIVNAVLGCTVPSRE